MGGGGGGYTVTNILVQYYLSLTVNDGIKYNSRG